MAPVAYSFGGAHSGVEIVDDAARLHALLRSCRATGPRFAALTAAWSATASAPNHVGVRLAALTTPRVDGQQS
jgi:hypothetical protein